MCCRCVSRVTQLGPENIAAVFAMAQRRRMLTRAKPKHDISGLRQAPNVRHYRCSARLRCWLSHHRDDDPTSCAPCSMQRRKASSRKGPRLVPAAPSAACLRPPFANSTARRPRPSMSCRWRQARVWRREPQSRSCTLCHACVTACPTGALSIIRTAPCCASPKACAYNADCAKRPVREGIRWSRGFDFQAWNAPLRVLRKKSRSIASPAASRSAPRSSIDRVLAKLGEKHWMFQGANAGRIDVIKCAPTAASRPWSMRGLIRTERAATAVMSRKIIWRARYQERRSVRIVRSLSCPPAPTPQDKIRDRPERVRTTKPAHDRLLTIRTDRLSWYRARANNLRRHHGRSLRRSVRIKPSLTTASTRQSRTF